MKTNKRVIVFYSPLLLGWVAAILTVSWWCVSPSHAQFVVHTVAGPLPSAPLQKLDEDWTVRLGGAAPRLLAGAELVGLRRENVPLPARPLRAKLDLSNGDCLVLASDSPFMLADERLNCRLAISPLDVKVAAATLAVLWLLPPENADDPALLAQQLRTGRRPRDVVWLRNGDRLEGRVKALSPQQGCQVVRDGQPSDVPWSQLALVAFNTEFQARLRARRPYAHVVLRNGTRLSFATLRLESGSTKLVGKALFGANLEIPLEELVALAVRQGPAVYLSDLTPKQYTQTPFLGPPWPLGLDTSVAGRELRLAGNSHDKGLGMHAQGRVTYDLHGQYRWFEAWVGLDEHTGRRGRVRLQVLVDGKEQDLGYKGELTSQDTPRLVRIDVRHARQLTLGVLFGTLGDVQAHVNWVEARLIK